MNLGNRLPAAVWFEVINVPASSGFDGAIVSLDPIDLAAFDADPKPAGDWQAAAGEDETRFRLRVIGAVRARGLAGRAVYVYQRSTWWRWTGRQPVRAA